MQAAQSLRLYYPTNLMVLEVSVANREASVRPLVVNQSICLHDLGASSAGILLLTNSLLLCLCGDLRVTPRKLGVI